MAYAITDLVRRLIETDDVMLYEHDLNIEKDHAPHELKYFLNHEDSKAMWSMWVEARVW